MIIEEPRHAMKQPMTLAAGTNDLVGGELLTLFDIPDDVRTDAVALFRQQLTAHIGEQKRAQHLEAIDGTGEIRSFVIERAIHLRKTLRSSATNGGHFRVHTAQAEIRAKRQAPRRPRAP